MTLLLAVLGASLLGSPHCAGMCGGFVCFYAGGDAAARRAAHAAYNLGRLASYVVLGALAGALGAGLDRAGALAGVSRAAAVLGGTIMVTWGLSRALAAAGVRLPSVVPAGVPERLVGGALRRLRGHSPTARASAIGLLSTLLPCGWLYAFVATAAAAGSAGGGMLVMVAFWAGTLPLMIGLAWGAQRMLGPLRRRLPAVSAAVLVVLGLLTIAGRIGGPGPLPALGSGPPAHVGH